MKSLLLFLLISIFGAGTSFAQTQYYDGYYDGEHISATITWNSNETLTGSYFFYANKSRVYKISGTNFVQGEIEITESLNGKRTASGTLTKKLTKNKVTWSGEMRNNDGSDSYIFLERIR